MKSATLQQFTRCQCRALVSSDTWWKLNGDAVSALPRLQVWQLPWEEISAVAALLDRTVQLNVSIVGGTIYLDNGSDSASLEPRLLNPRD